MKIYSYDRWNDLNEERINPLNKDKFLELLSKYAHNNHNVFLYKKIINPKTKMGIFYKSVKQFESHLNLNNTSKNLKGFPDRETSLVCYNYIEKEEGETFIIFPFKSSLFTIDSKIDINESDDCYKKGYWVDKIKWLENIGECEMWTDSPCLIISKSEWNKLLKLNI